MEFTAIGKLLDYVVKLGEEIEKRDSRAAMYFEELGKTLAQIHAELTLRQIPTEAGNKFKVLVAHFDKSVNGLRAKGHLKETVGEVKRAAQIAQRLDWHYLNNENYIVEEKREKWLHELEQLAGRLQGIAVVLRS